MFNCKACKSKDDHIADLQKTIEFMKRQLLPGPQLPSMNLEANFALDGGGREEIQVHEPLSPEQQAEMDRIEAEEVAILSGDYEHTGLQ